jgi:hypothetical protein
MHQRAAQRAPVDARGLCGGVRHRSFFAGRAPQPPRVVVVTLGAGERLEATPRSPCPGDLIVPGAAEVGNDQREG